MHAVRYSKEHKEQTGAKIRDALRRGFRQEGYAGLSVDAIAEAAGVTSGAFYSHYRSKSAAFREIVQEGMADLGGAMRDARTRDPQDWLAKFSRWYLSFPHKRTENELSLPIRGACALPTLSPAVARCEEDTREIYENELVEILDAVTQGLPGSKRDARRTAWAYLALLTGSIVLARAVPSERIAKEICQAALQAVLRLVGPMARTSSGK